MDNRTKLRDIEIESLPWKCPKHPNAQIRHSWDEKRYVMNQYPVGQRIKCNHKYECAECGLELKPENL